MDVSNKLLQKTLVNSDQVKLFSPRQSYFDFLRGIAIIMVVAIHSFSVVYSYANITIIAVIIRQLMNVAVPIFCVLSAYFLINKTVGRKNYFAFLKKQIVRVYVPLLFFSLPSTSIIKRLVMARTNNNYSRNNFLIFMGCKKGMPKTISVFIRYMI